MPLKAKVRPWPNSSPDCAEPYGSPRLFVSKDTLIALTGQLNNDIPCNIQLDTPDDDRKIKTQGFLFAVPGQKVGQNVVQLSKAFQQAAGFKLGDQVTLELPDGELQVATEVFLEDITKQPVQIPEGNRRFPFVWEVPIAACLGRAQHVFPGMLLEGVSIGHHRRSFKVVSVNRATEILAKFSHAHTVPRVLQADEADAIARGKHPPHSELRLEPVPGLRDQVEQINTFFRLFNATPGVQSRYPSCALMIEGGRGTGKTFLLETLSEGNWWRVFRIEEFDKSATIREKFTQARAQQPSMVLLDDIQNIVSSDGTDRKLVINTLLEELDFLSAASAKRGQLEKTVVVGTCTDRLKDVPQRLQQRGRFFKTIVLPIPRVAERLEVLQYHAQPYIKDTEEETILCDLAENTYAYSCRDLMNLVCTAVDIKAQRLLDGFPTGQIFDEEERYVTAQDFAEAKLEVPASLMQDVRLQPQSVKWEDIGGQEDVKEILSRMIKHTKESKRPRMVRKPDKGLLLYGPPGCSKTLSARAMATESRFNFFSIKAGELLNMYVGESERQIREVFARARAASPAIIFFDEIESIAKARSGGGATDSGSGGVNTLTSLLTEMDGFETLSGVLIIAATNKPEAIDNALMRPGRFSKVVYVGPPNLEAREAVFRVHLRGQRLAPDVDFAELAAKTEGHSGSEIESIVTGAEQAVQVKVDDAPDDEAAREVAVISREDLFKAMEGTPKTITKEMLDGFDRWAKRAGFKKSASIFA